MSEVKITQNPTRADAQSLLESSQNRVLRGLRDPKTGTLYVWDAFESQHARIIAELKLTPHAERLIIESIDEMPQGVFAGETNYGFVVVGYDGSEMAQEISLSEWDEQARGIPPSVG